MTHRKRSVAYSG